MSKKTILTILGALVAFVTFIPIPLVLLKIVEFILGLLIIFFTRAKVTPAKSRV
jgi:hypothetical protein